MTRKIILVMLSSILLSHATHMQAMATETVPFATFVSAGISGLMGLGLSLAVDLDTHQTMALTTAWTVGGGLLGYLGFSQLTPENRLARATKECEHALSDKLIPIIEHAYNNAYTSRQLIASVNKYYALWRFPLIGAVTDLTDIYTNLFHAKQLLIKAQTQGAPTARIQRKCAQLIEKIQPYLDLLVETLAVIKNDADYLQQCEAHRQQQMVEAAKRQAAAQEKRALAAMLDVVTNRNKDPHYHSTTIYNF